MSMADGVRYAVGEAGPRAARPLPEGIVTFLFTDIEGSTRLLTEIGNAAYAEALAMHKTLVPGRR